MDMVTKLLNILNRCVEKVYSQMISLLFVFGELVAIAGLVDEGMHSMLLNYNSSHGFSNIGTLHLLGWP